MAHHGQSVYGQGRPMGTPPFRTGWPHTCTHILQERVQLYLVASPPLLFHPDFLLFSLFIQHVPWLAYQKWIYLWLSWDQDVEDSGCWLPHKRVLWLDQKHWSPKSPLGLSEGLHSCLMFRVRCITTNYLIIIVS